MRDNLRLTTNGRRRWASMPLYTAPEVLRDGEATFLSDQYSLGVLLYECVTGINPFRADTLRESIDLITAGQARRVGAPGVVGLGLEPGSERRPEVVIQAPQHSAGPARWSSALAAPAARGHRSDRARLQHRRPHRRVVVRAPPPSLGARQCHLDGVIGVERRSCEAPGAARVDVVRHLYRAIELEPSTAHRRQPRFSLDRAAAGSVTASHRADVSAHGSRAAR
jgi:hypothetical protein